MSRQTSTLKVLIATGSAGVDQLPGPVRLDGLALQPAALADEARQAMIVGLCHFARETGCRLIAEGIETQDELAILRALDIRLGQGYLLGRPTPVSAGRPQVPGDT